MIFVRSIQAAVAEHFKLPVEAMRERDGIGTRLRERAHPRQLGMCLASRLTDHSYCRIGQLFGRRDHSTVITGIRAAERRIANDPDTREAARTLTKQLLHESGLL